LDNDEDNESMGEYRNSCGHFETFSMLKTLDDYKWEVGTYFI